MSELAAWPYQPDLCPADDHFCEWLEHYPRPLSPATVLHVGTGLHHKVGLACVSMDTACIGVTASRDEWITSPALPDYQVLLSDIYKLDTRLLPQVAVLTLFHLGELEYMFGPIQTYAVLNLIRKVVPTGCVVFYVDSSNWKQAREFVEQAVSENVLCYSTHYKSLAFYLRI